MLGSYQFRSQSKGDESIGSQTILLRSNAGLDNILVHTLELDVLILDRLMPFLAELFRNPEPLFEILLNLPAPIGKLEHVIVDANCVEFDVSFQEELVIVIKTEF